MQEQKEEGAPLTGGPVDLIVRQTAQKRDVLVLLRGLERHGEDNIWRTAKEAREEIERLRAELAEWGKLRNPVALHANLLRGVPAQLSREMLRHITGEDTPNERDAKRYRWLLEHGAPMGVIDWGVLGLSNQDTDGLGAMIDEAMGQTPNAKAQRGAEGASAAPTGCASNDGSENNLQNSEANAAGGNGE